MTHGRSVGPSPLAWGEFSQLFMARFLPKSIRDGLAHEFERLEQTELEQRQKEKGSSGRDFRKKQRVEGSQSSHPSVGVGSVPNYEVQQRAISQSGGSSGQSFGTHSVVDQIRGALHGPLFHSGIGMERSGTEGRGQARVFATTRQDAQASNAVVM
ncbi:hypothetical protein SESBI_45915 [Sesbania bispinosa]|nr:hypothetical protein SESBI_45915 [Sesbania bispinosa]